MKRRSFLPSMITIVAGITGITLFQYLDKKSAYAKSAQEKFTHGGIKKSSTIDRYIAKDLLNQDLLSMGLSKKQLQEHYQLYRGYVTKRNEIAVKLNQVDRSDAANRTYSAYRSLKLAEPYAINGSILHELYFENLSNTTTKMGPLTHKLITQSFGSVECFKQDFMDASGCSRGWAITAYSVDDGELHNFIFEEHNQNIPILVLPLLVLDVYEHAYMIDFGINRTPYLELFWNHIDWCVVEKRITQWVQPFLIHAKKNSSPQDV